MNYSSHWSDPANWSESLAKQLETFNELVTVEDAKQRVALIAQLVKATRDAERRKLVEQVKASPRETWSRAELLNLLTEDGR